jgi:adenine phosphoribosyltransferase
MKDSRLDSLRGLIREVPDFPKPGILFYDITTMLKARGGLELAVELLAEQLSGRGVEHVVAMESRGFIFGAPLAMKLGAGFVPVRKPGKLPAETVSASYELEYGTDTLEIHKDAVGAGQKVAVVDDLLATGGTAAATVRLVRSLGAEVVAVAFVIELDFLSGRRKLSDVEVCSLLHYA